MEVGSPFIYLVRFAESGRDAQPERQGLRRDLAEVIAAAVPGAAIETAGGRLLIESGEPADDVLALPEGGSFCVRVKRVGASASGARALAAELGRAIVASRPDLTVDLRSADAIVGVEERGEDYYVFHRTIPGLDRRPADTPVPPGEPRFLADQMLGRLAVWLRLIGYDTAQPLDRPDSWLLRLAREEGRILLTQDAPLARATSAHTYYVNARGFEDQLIEVVRAFDLAIDPARLLSRCTRCNSRVDPVAAEAARPLVPPAVSDAHQVFFACPSCRKIYWRGDHCERILDRLAGLALA